MPFGTTETMSGPFFDGGSPPVCRSSSPASVKHSEIIRAPSLTSALMGYAEDPALGRISVIVGWLAKGENVYSSPAPGGWGREAHRNLGMKRIKAQGWERRVMRARASCQWEPQGYFCILVPRTVQDRALWHIPRDLPPNSRISLSCLPHLSVTKVGISITFLNFQNTFITICKDNREEL